LAADLFGVLSPPGAAPTSSSSSMIALMARLPEKKMCREKSSWFRLPQAPAQHDW